MSQSRTHSAMEAVANVAISMVIGLATQLVMFPALGIPVSIDQNLIILAVMTVVSLVRSYCLRRLFDRVSKA